MSGAARSRFGALGFPAVIAALVLAGVAMGMTGAGSQRPAEIAVLDRAGFVGPSTAIAIGTNRFPFITYFDETNLDLKLAGCSNAACSRATISVIDRGTTGQLMTGLYTSIAVTANGPLISYYDIDATALRLARCSPIPARCLPTSRITIDERFDVGLWTSVRMGSDGLALISYHDALNGDLKVAHCSDPGCARRTVTTLDRTGRVGAHTSLAIGSDGLGLISYYDETNADLKVAHCENTLCTRRTVSPLDGSGDLRVGRWTSITIGAEKQGLGLISYWDETNGALKVAHCDNVPCTGATVSTLDNGANRGQDNVGQYTAITRDRDGRGLISYFDETNEDLKIARCANTLCTRASNATFDSAGRVGRWTSITLGTDRLALIAYYDVQNGDLKTLHCRVPFCGLR